MPSINRTVFINAPPEEVFDLICRVEDFSVYSSHIKEIKQVSPGVYRWRAEFLGFTLEWEATVTESIRPERFAWISSKGVFNTGRYTLKKRDGGTDIAFQMEFSLTGSPLERIIAPLLNEIISHVAEEMLLKVKARLEA
jgi:uncharacterized membrane protein